MTVSFTSTYSVPFHQGGGRKAIGRIDELKAFAQKHGGIVPSSRHSGVQFSVRKKFDATIQAALVQLGFKEYEVVPLHNVPQAQISNALTGRGRFAPKPPPWLAKNPKPAKPGIPDIDTFSSAPGLEDVTRTVEDRPIFQIRKSFDPDTYLNNLPTVGNLFKNL